MSDEPSILNIILTKINKLDERMDESNIILAKQEVSLSEHIKRTNILEDKIEPVERHVQLVNSILKIIGGIAVLMSIITGIIKVIEVLH